jgi:PAS domain S-box-containing protein
VVVEHTSRDDELQRSEQRFRNLVEGSIQGLVVYVDNKPVFANQAMANILGHDGPDDILRLESSDDFVHPGEIERLAGYRRDRLLGRAAPDIYEFRALRKDGSTVWLESRPTIAEWDGQRAIQGTCVDISERKRAEAALSESEARFRDFAEVASDWYWQSDARHRFTEYSVNDSEATMADREWNNILGKTRFERRHPDDSDDEIWQRHVADLEARRPFRNFVYRSQDIEGESRYVRVSGKPVFNAGGGFVGYRGTGSDVTELRRRDAALKQSEQRFRNLAEGSIQGLIVHVGAKPIFANQAIANLLGYDSPHDMLGVESFEDFLCPSAFQAIRAIATTSKRGDPLPETVEMGMLRRDGVPVWVEARPTVVDWDGRPATLATIVDITRRKSRDDELRASEQRFRNLAEGSIQGLIVHIGSTPVFANQAFADILGYDSPDEVFGLISTKAFLHPADAERTLEIRERLLRGESAPGVLELLALRKDGTTVWIEVRPTVVKWDGEPAIHSAVVDISERKRAEEALEASERRFKDFTESGSDWYWESDAEHRFTAEYVNFDTAGPQSWRRVVGLTRFDFRVDDDRDDASWIAHRADLEAHRPFRNFSYRILHKDGTYHHIKTNGKPIFDDKQQFVGYRGTASDVTAEMEAREAAARAQAELQDAIASISEGFAYFDADDRLVYINERYREIAHEAADLMVPGRTMAEIVRQSAARGIYAGSMGNPEAWKTERLKRFRKAEGSHEIERSDGRCLRVSERKTSSGGTVSVAFDITERKRAEDALARAHDELEAKVEERTEALQSEIGERKLAEEEATRANQAKSEFLSSMSHELRTPLNAMLGFTQLLRDFPDQPLSEEQKGHIGQIIDGGKHLLGLVNEVLDLSRVESGRLDLTPEPTALAQAVRESLILVQPLAEERGITVSFAAHAGSALMVQADPSRLKQVLLNVLSNAVKYNHAKGSVTVSTTTGDGDLARVDIRDTGPGIAADRHDEVFRPFSRLGAEASKIEGTGIGLTISRQLIESMGGTLDFTSTPGQGSTFWIELPLTEPGTGDA